MRKYIAYYLGFTWAASVPMIYFFVAPDFVENQTTQILVTIFLAIWMGAAVIAMYREINHTELE